jgi:hypothetical protein
MAVYNLTKRLRNPGEFEYTPSVQVPPGLTQFKAVMNLTPSDMQDPTVDLLAVLEWSEDNGDTWKLLASTRLQGNPANRTDVMPYISLGADILQRITGALVRAYFKTATQMNCGATVTVA